MSMDLFARRIRPVNRKEVDSGVEAFLRNGGKVAKLHDSETAAEIMTQRKNILKKALKAERRSGVIGGTFLTSDAEAIIKT